VVEPAPLHLGDDVGDEIGIGARHVRGRHHEAVAAALDEHFFQSVGDLLRPADDGIVHLPTARELDEFARRRIALAGSLQHAVTDAQNTLHAFQLFGRDRLVETLCGEIEVQRLCQQRQRIDLQRQLVDHRHLVFGFRLGRANHGRGQVAQEHLVGIAAGFCSFVPDGGIAFLGPI